MNDPILVKRGLAYTINGQIYMNERLLDHPRLWRKVYVHELRHVNKEPNVDWNESFDWGLVKFVLTTPSTWIEASPVWIHGNKISINKFLLYVYAALFGYMLIIGGLIVWVLR